MFSCEYEPNGENFVKIDPITIVPTLNVDLNVNSDTVFVPINYSPYLTYKSEDTLLKVANAYLDDKLYSTNNSKDGEFNFSLSGIENSIHYLRVEFFKRSGTGSIADKLGAEGFVYSKSWVIIFKFENEVSSKIYKFKPTEGTLNIEWTKYQGIGFKEYRIYHGDGSGNILDTIAFINDINTVSYIDSSFVGYKLEYIVEIKTDKRILGRISSFFEDQLPKAWVNTNSEGKFLIRWDQNKYLKNIKQYDIYETFHYQWNVVNKIASTNNASDLQYIFDNSKWGVISKFYINPIPKKNNHPIKEFNVELKSKSSFTNESVLGDSISQYMDNIIAAPLGDYCYYQIPNYVCKYNSKSATTEKYPIIADWSRLIASLDGKLLVVFTSGNFKLYNTASMNTINTVSQKDISGYDVNLYNPNFKFSLSNSGIVVFYNQGIFIYDLINNKLLGSFIIDDFSNIGYFLKISPMADYISLNYYTNQNKNISCLYKFENNKLTKLFENTCINFNFDPNNSNFIFFNDNKLTIKSLSTLTTNHEILINAKYVSSLDFNNNEILGISSDMNNLMIIDINTGNIKYNISTLNYQEYNFLNCTYLINKTLFVQSSDLNGGYKLKLNY
jgi:hypothetical protein